MLGVEFDPMEIVREMRSKSPAEEDPGALRGLSQEEFERIFNEVGYELSYDTVYVVRPLRTRTGKEVTAAVQEAVLRLKSEGLHISRVHADRARCWKRGSL